MQGGFLDCARNDSVGNGYPVHHAKKECVGNAFFSYRHPERSRGIFFVGGKRASVWQRETGNVVSRKGGGGVSRKRLGEGGGKRDLFLLEMRGISPKKVLTYETAHHSYLREL